MARRNRRNPFILAFRDSQGRPHSAFGGFVSEEAFRELKEREKDKTFKTRIQQALNAANQRRKAAKRHIAASRLAQQRRKKRLSKAGVKVPSHEQRAKQLNRGRPTAQLSSSTNSARSSVYVYEGIDSLDLVKAHIRLTDRRTPKPLTRIVIRAGDGRYAESMGTFWNTPAGTLLGIIPLLTSESAKKLFAIADENAWPIYIELEVMRPHAKTTKLRKATKRKPAKRKPAKRKRSTVGKASKKARRV